MSIGEKVRNLMDWIADGIGGSEYEPDIIDVIDDGTAYPVMENAALNPEYVQRPRKNERNVVTPLNNNYKEHEVKVIEPRSFGESKQIVKQLLDNRTVVLKLHLLDKEQAQRAIDVVCGAAYALGGTPQKIDDTVFLFTPSSVKLSVEVKEADFGTESLWGNL